MVQVACRREVKNWRNTTHCSACSAVQILTDSAADPGHVGWSVKACEKVSGISCAAGNVGDA